MEYLNLTEIEYGMNKILVIEDLYKKQMGKYLILHSTISSFGLLMLIFAIHLLKLDHFKNAMVNKFNSVGIRKNDRKYKGQNIKYRCLLYWGGGGKKLFNMLGRF